MNSSPSPEIQHYSQLVRTAMGDSFDFAPEAEAGDVIQVERGIVFPMALAGPTPSQMSLHVNRLMIGNAERATVVDRAGHRRAAYPGLLCYAWVQALRISVGDDAAIERGRDILRAWCKVMEERVNSFSWATQSVPALLGAAATGAAWAALALYAAHGVFALDRWAELARGYFRNLAAVQQSCGALLLAGASDNPETLWYHELVLLHAAASYAAQAQDERVTASVLRAADYHLNETQPDHASSQPWGLLAFIWNRNARPLADQLLHSMRAQPEGRTNVISSMLLADCLYCLSLVHCR
jgi:hypothetical protein